MRNILIKGSGDITDSQQFFDFVVQKRKVIIMWLLFTEVEQKLAPR